MRLILASRSSRRKQLLEKVGFSFLVHHIDIKESFPATIPVSDIAEFLAKKKNNMYKKIFQNDIILTADTMVIYDEQVLGKPKNFVEAKESLLTLSNNIHEVFTGVCISNKEKNIHFTSKTQVKFCTITHKEVDFYLSNYQPYDKAGSYGIQEWIGLIGIEWIKGSYYNVMGLPIDKVYKVLVKDFAFSIEKKQ